MQHLFINPSYQRLYSIYNQQRNRIYKLQQQKQLTSKKKNPVFLCGVIMGLIPSIKWLEHAGWWCNMIRRFDEKREHLNRLDTQRKKKAQTFKQEKTQETQPGEKKKVN